jgi:hypothetical protein
VVLSLFCNLLLSLRQSSVDDTTHPWVPLMCKRQKSWDSSSCWKFDEQASLWIFGMRVVSSSMKAQSVMKKRHVPFTSRNQSCTWID